MNDKDKELVWKFMKGLHLKWHKSAGKKPVARFGNPLNRKNLKHRCMVIDLIPKKKGNFLDIGLGSGRYLFTIAQLRDYNLYSVDHPQEKTNLKYKFFKDYVNDFKIELKLQDIAEGLPYKDNFFDVVMFNNVIEHMQPKDVFPVMKEMNRVLKKGGLLILETPNFLSFVHRVKAVLGMDFGYDIGEKVTKDRGYPQHIKEYTANELRTIMKNYGFKIEKTIMSYMQYDRFFVDLICNIMAIIWPSSKNQIVITARKQ